MALRLDVEPGQVVKIGDDVFITLEHKSGRRAKLSIVSKLPVTVTEPTEEPRSSQGFYRRPFSGT